MTILQSLKRLNSYPLHNDTIVSVCLELGLNGDEKACADTMNSKAYKRAKARVYIMLSQAPNVSQGGVSYSFSDEDRKCFRMQAQALLEEAGENSTLLTDEYGWMGEDL